MPLHSKFSFTCDFRTQQYNYKLTKIIEVNFWAKIFPPIQERMFSLFGAYHIIHKKNYQKFFIKTIHWFEINLYWYYAPFLEIKKKNHFRIGDLGPNTQGISLDHIYDLCSHVFDSTILSGWKIVLKLAQEFGPSFFK